MGRCFYYIFIVFFLTSCISMSKSEKTADLLPAIPIEMPSKEGLFSLGRWPSVNWWEVFEDSELSSLIQVALEKNPSISSVSQKLELFKQKTVIQRSKLFPLLFFDANESWQYVSQNGLLHTLNPTLPLNSNLIDLSLSFNYEVDIWGKYRNLFKAAVGREKAEEAEKADVILTVTTTLSQAYFALRVNLYRQSLYERILEIQKDLLFLQEERQKSALISKLPLLLSREHLEEARKNLYQIKEEIKVAKHLINSIIGKGPDHCLDMTATLPQFPKSLSLPENLGLDLLSRRPDLVAAIWRVEAYSHEVSAAITDFYPNINLKGLIGLQSFGFDKLFLASSKEAGLYPAIHLPIFTAGAIKANVKGRKAEFHSAVFDYNKLLLDSAKEVADYLSICQTVFDKLKSEEIILSSSKERFDLSLLRYDMGLDNRLEALTLESEWLNLELQNALLVYNQYLAAIKLIKSLGGGYNEPS
jgi:NodT family efflux transporter outer membrane factor (OMF) lipoprotein